ncbi:unnamed protein product [Medioppia subpectinata]|uniref:Amine oxidase domain-containing protein n=1 Tax=Medioppia subpectinata TaxID=1979941 RepID=A0A7R9KBL0_9ACAR|nr:unnamed protein product [Medioppia subpectinata]CAG2100453.1 unnamed protein product [Medioppia subpectinata]
MSSEAFGDVVIVGCGIGGLSVAYHLMMNDFAGRIIVLEARPVIGGRISSTTTKFENHRIEIGANWIHGILGNPIYDLALRHRLIDQLAQTSGKHLVEARAMNGAKVDINLLEEVYRTYVYFMKKCENYFHIEDTDGAVRYDNSMGKLLEADIDSWVNSLKDVDTEGKELRKCIFNTLLNRETCISGCNSMDEMSLKDFGSYSELPGGNTTIPLGFNQVLNALLNEINERVAAKSKLGDKSNLMDGKQFSILKSQRVTKIKWRDLTADGNTPAKVEILCENGSTYICNHVVVTVPLGVLKRESLNLFVPKLPQYKLDAIKALGFGAVDKIFLEYSLPLNNFIDVNVDETIVVWDKQNPPKCKALQKIYSISKITNHLLLMWASGDEAIHLETMDEQQLNEELTQLLQQFFNNKKFPKADNVIITRWATDPYSYGSYSYIPTGSSVRDIELLSQPIYADPSSDKPIMVFAGEATHPSFYSTVHGAFLSGKKAANYLLDATDDNVSQNEIFNTRIASKM